MIAELTAYINGTIDTVLIKYDRNIVTTLMLEDALLNPKKGKYKPFHQRLIPTELFRFQAFFRSIETSIGSGIFEYMARLISKANTKKWVEVKKSEFDVTNDKKVTGFIDEFIETLSTKHKERNKKKTELKKKEKDKDKKKEIEIQNAKEKPADYLLPDFPTSENESLTKQQIDLYLKDINNVEYFIEIKSPKPNKDQSKETKRKLLKFKATYPKSKIIYGLTFNPYGAKRKDFQNSYIHYYFDITDSDTLKVGSEFWDFLGGPGIYQELLEVFENIGKLRKDEIYRKLLRNYDE